MGRNLRELFLQLVENVLTLNLGIQRDTGPCIVEDGLHGVGWLYYPVDKPEDFVECLFVKFKN